MSLFVLSSKDGWVNIMYDGLDAVGIDQQVETGGLAVVMGRGGLLKVCPHRRGPLAAWSSTTAECPPGQNRQKEMRLGPVREWPVELLATGWGTAPGLDCLKKGTGEIDGGGGGRVCHRTPGCLRERDGTREGEKVASSLVRLEQGGIKQNGLAGDSEALCLSEYN